MASLKLSAQYLYDRLQLMCYKYLWDSLIAKKFPAENFFSYFDLDPNYLLSDDIKWYTNSLGVNAKVLTLYSFSKSSQAIYWWFWPTSLLMGNCSIPCAGKLHKSWKILDFVYWLSVWILMLPSITYFIILLSCDVISVCRPLKM